MQDRTILERREGPAVFALLLFGGLVCAWVLLIASPIAAGEMTQVPGLIRALLPVVITPIGGSPVTLEGMVTRPAGPGPFPLALINHGTPRKLEDIPLTSPASFSAVAIEFAKRGWAAAVVLRRGYGKSGGAVVEDIGPCNDRNYFRAGQVSADDVLAVLNVLRAEAWVDPARILLVGLSTGGFAVSAASARNPAGVVAVLNFAGGRGSRAPDDVCQPERLVAAQEIFGRTARLPSLWIYAENDHFFGPALAQRMFQAFTAHGAPATFFAAPSFGEDGHGLFLGAVNIWWPPVQAFLDAQHLPTRIAVELPAVPHLSAPRPLSVNGQAAWSSYVASMGYEKAFAVGTRIGYGYFIGGRTTEDAVHRALENCGKNAPDCFLYAIGNELAH
jgi:dienelactone hydrolase